MDVIAVFGGSGFLGSHLVDKLGAVDKNRVVVNCDIRKSPWTPDGAFIRADIRDGTGVQAALDSLKASCVINLAGVLGTSETFDDVPATYQTNVIGTANVLDACHRLGSKYIGVQTGTDWLNPYAASKRAATDLARVYADAHGLPVTILKVFNAYGPRQNGTGKVAKIVPRFIKCIHDHTEIPINGDGNQPIDLVPAEVVAQAFVSAVRNSRGHGEVIDVGTGIPTTVNHVAFTICRMMGATPRFEYRGMRPGEGGHYPVADPSSLISMLRVEPPVDPFSAMPDTIDWYIRNRTFLERPDVWGHDAD
jgi:UDP-glucose 4-epimerase